MPQPEESRRTVVHRGWIRVSIAGMVWFLLAAMLARGFLGDTFVIRTASMEPTIAGRPSRGDRVLLSSLYYRLEAPRRWDIVLFRYPNNLSTHYMKRLVGLGAEQVVIHGGDLYEADVDFAGEIAEGLASGALRILRKPPAVQESIFRSFPVPFAGGLDPFSADRFWLDFARPVSGEEAWTPKNGEVLLRGDSMVFTRATPRDTLYDALGDRPPGGIGTALARGENLVGDLSLRLDVRAEDAGGVVRLVIRDPVAGVVVEARLDITERTAVLRIGGKDLARREDAPVSPGDWLALRLDAVDDFARLFIDEEEVVSCQFDAPPLPDEEGREAAAGGVGLGGEGGVFRFRHPRILRDIHYTQTGQTRFLVPPGQLLFLGDNSLSSADSRLWKRVAIQVARTGEILEGDAQGVTLRSIRPPGRNPWLEPDGRRAFADHLGRIHLFESPSEYVELGSWPTPYVPSDLVLGRGVMILSPPGRAGLLR